MKHAFLALLTFSLLCFLSIQTLCWVTAASPSWSGGRQSQHSFKMDEEYIQNVKDLVIDELHERLRA